MDELGICFDDKLKWQDHIDGIIVKLSRAVGIMYKLKFFVPAPALRSVYYSLFHSYIQYGLLAWNTASKTALAKIGVLQNKAIRILAGLPPSVSASSAYKDLKILKLADIRTLEIAKLMHQFENDRLPAAFRAYFTQQSAVHNYTTRSASKGAYYVPRFSNSRTKGSIKYIGVKVWNSIPQSITSRPYNSFKKSLKSHLLSYY